MDASGPASCREPFFNSCNICDQVPTNPVCTTCGHMYCWACLYTWLERQVLFHHQAGSCFRCGTFVNIDLNIIPMYGIGQVGESSSAAQNRQYPGQSQSIPPRPTPPNLLPYVIVNYEDCSDSSTYQLNMDEYMRQLQGGYGIFAEEFDQADRDRLAGYVYELINVRAEIKVLEDTLQRLRHGRDVLENRINHPRL